MEGHGIDLVRIVALLGAGVVAVPIFTRFKLGSVLAYFVAGLAIGPFGVGLFTHPQEILHVAELGVIMLLFVIGLEMNLSRLWRLRREIFGLGAAQVIACGMLLTGVGIMLGLSPAVAFVAGMGFVLSSTAVVMQMLADRGMIGTPQGQKAISILLFEDLSIVPLLAIVTFLSPLGLDSDGSQRAQEIGIALASVVALVVIGKFGLNPMFRLLAAARAREVMTAAALLVVLGSALLMELGGLSMAMGAFLAGVLLSESTFRHQLEADIEPFRGILLGLFFLAVGMALDLAVIAKHWQMIALSVAAFTIIKSAGIFVVARLFGCGNRDALTRTSLFAQGGEFAFVLYAAASDADIFTGDNHAIFTAVVIMSMALTPVLALLIDKFVPAPKPSLDGIEKPDGLQNNILIIGFGRFAQVASQALLARGCQVSIIESDVGMIRAASSFGFKVYYGEGSRLDVLRASGADKAQAILICVNQREMSNKIVRLVQAEFPTAKLYVRAYDRGHAIDLVRSGVDYYIRETFESAMRFSEAVLNGMGVPDEEAADIIADVRRRDEERLALQVVGDYHSGANLLHNNSPTPTPLIKPKQQGEVIHGDDAEPAKETGAAV